MLWPSMLGVASLHDQYTELIVVLLVTPLVMAALVVTARLRDMVPGVPEVIEDPPADRHPVEVALLWSAYRKHFSPRTAFRTELIHLASTGTIVLEVVGRVSDPE